MKNIFSFLLWFLLFFSFRTYGQKFQYQGKFHADETMYRGITSKLVLYADSFELVYHFAPSQLLHDLNNPKLKFADRNKVDMKKNNTSTFPVSSGAARKIYKGVWRVNNTEEFLKDGFDMTIIHAAGYDSVESDVLHLTHKDGELLQFIFNDNTILWGFASPQYLTSPTIFVNNTIGEVFLMDQQ